MGARMAPTGKAKPRAPRVAATTAQWTPARLREALGEAYGPRPDWWPVDRAWHAEHGTDPRFEVVLGAVLTQNTNWRNVEKALARLKREGALDPRVLLEAPAGDVEAWIRSSGTYREKARRLLEVLHYFRERGGLDLDAYRDAASMAPGQARRELLALRGVGPETADTILLYALGFPFFIVDAYTRRILARLGAMPENAPYDEVARWFAEGGRDAAAFQEFHALLVEHAKARCASEPTCAGCPLLASCAYGSASGPARSNLRSAGKSRPQGGRAADGSGASRRARNGTGKRSGRR